jgi:hypothetical protein
LQNGGWYFALNDYLDVTMMGTLYSRGTWGLDLTTGYRKRYKYNGHFDAQYYRNRINDGTETEQKGSKDFRVVWSHAQDAKANPTQSFSANVNFSTKSYESNHSYNINEYLTNTKSSSIAYHKSWPGKPYNFAVSLNHSQNSNTGTVDLNIPNASFNVTRLYPFRSKKTKGSYKWFQNIQISYNSKLENRISAGDSTLFTHQTLEQMKNGFSHSIPISLTNIKLLKIINITPGLSYEGVLYTSHIYKRISEDSAFYFNLNESQLTIDTIRGLTYAHALKPSIGISASPKLYARFVSKKPERFFRFCPRLIRDNA